MVLVFIWTESDFSVRLSQGHQLGGGGAEAVVWFEMKSYGVGKGTCRGRCRIAG